MGLTKFQQPRFVCFPVNTAHQPNRCFIQVCLGTYGLKSLLNGRLTGIPLAADPQNGDPWNDFQHVPFCPVYGQQHIRRLILRQLYAMGRHSLNGPRAAHPNGPAGQQPGRNMLDSLGILHHAALNLGPAVHRKHAVLVCGSGDHRGCAAQSGHLLCQCICTAQMAAEQGNSKPSGFVHHHHSGVLCFRLYIGCNGTDRNPRRTHKDQPICMQEALPRPCIQRQRPSAAHGLSRKPFRQTVCQPFAPVRKGNELNIHLVASRNSVEKAGS